MNYGLLFLGIGLIVVAVVLFVGDILKNRSELRDLEKANARTELLIEELNELSSVIVDEMDRKYNNMLHIYNELLTAAEPIQYSATQDMDEGIPPETEARYNRRSNILSLYAQGKTPSEIAKELTTGIGEVELTLKLAGRGVGKNG